MTGYGTTIQDALEDLLSQLYEGPQKWLAKLVVERDAFVSKLKQEQMAKDKKHSPAQLGTKPSAAISTPPSSSLVAPSPPLSAGPPTQVSNINSTGHPAVSKKQGASTDKTAPTPQIAVAGSYQGIKPKADTLFKNLPAWVIGDKTADTKSAGSSSNSGFAFGSGPILSSSGAYSVFSKPLNPAPKFGDGIVPFEFNGSFGKKAVLDEARERQKRKEDDMDSDEDEEDWEKRDAARQARKKAKLLTLTPPSRQTFGTFSQSLQPARITFWVADISPLRLGSCRLHHLRFRLSATQTLSGTPTPQPFIQTNRTMPASFTAPQPSPRLLPQAGCLRRLLKIFSPDYQQRPKKDAKSDRVSRRLETIRPRRRSKLSIQTLQHLTRVSWGK